MDIENVRALKQLLEMATGPHTTLDEATAIYEVEKHFKAQERAYLALSERHDEAVKIAHIMTDKANDHCVTIAALSERVGEALRLLERLKSLETRDVHTGYDNGVGGGNYVYEDYIAAADAFAIASEIGAALSHKGMDHG